MFCEIKYKSEAAMLMANFILISYNFAPISWQVTCLHTGGEGTTEHREATFLILFFTQQFYNVGQK